MSVTVIDPRMPAATRDTALAPRPSSLVGRRVLLFDNDKLAPGYGPYRAIFDILDDALVDVDVVRHTDDLLRGTHERLDDVVRQVDRLNVDGVIFALCDWGVSLPTALVAAGLESRGVPTSLVATPIGAQQVLSTAQRSVPGLPVTLIESSRSDTYETVANATRACLDRIVEGLTADHDALHARFASWDVATPAPASPSGTLELDGADPSVGFTEAMHDSRLGDGLPLVAPTPRSVEEMLSAAGVGPDEEIWPAVPPRPSPVTAREVAALAVAAGCRPRWAPVVFAAFRAMAAPEFRLFQAAITTHPAGTLVLVSGPDHARFGFRGDRGSLGPGFPANATTGRAVALSYSFLLGALPGGSDLTSQGSPAEFTYCAAENLTENPWAGLHEDLGHAEATTVTVLKCEGPHLVVDDKSTDPPGLLRTFASSMATLGSNASYVAGAETVLLLNPEHAEVLAGAGWSKRDVREFVFDVARNRREDLRGRGLGTIWPAWFDAAEQVPVLPTPDDLLVVVTGGAGPASQIAIPWGYSRAVTRLVTAPGA